MAKTRQRKRTSNGSAEVGGGNTRAAEPAPAARRGGGRSSSARASLTIAEVEAFAARVRAALEEADADRRTVEALRALVGGAGRRGGARVPRAAGARGAAQANDGRILSFVREAKDGARVGDMMKTLRMNRKALTRALRRLRDGGQVKMTGHKRLARYFAA